MGARRRKIEPGRLQIGSRVVPVAPEVGGAVNPLYAAQAAAAAALEEIGTRAAARAAAAERIKDELRRWCRQQDAAGYQVRSVRALATALGITPANVLSTLAGAGSLGRYAPAVSAATGIPVEVLAPAGISSHQERGRASAALRRMRRLAPGGATI